MSPAAQIATMQQHVSRRDAILGRMCIRDADETSPAGAGVGRELRSLDINVDGVALAVVVGSHIGQEHGLSFRL